MQNSVSRGFEFNRPTIVSLVYIVGLVTALPTLIAPMLAYVWRAGPHEAWEESHFRYHIRSFWIGLAAFVAAWMLTILLIGFPLLVALWLWLLVRAILSLGAAQRHEPIANPAALLW